MRLFASMICLFIFLGVISLISGSTTKPPSSPATEGEKRLDQPIVRTARKVFSPDFCVLLEKLLTEMSKNTPNVQSIREHINLNFNGFGKDMLLKALAKGIAHVAKKAEKKCREMYGAADAPTKREVSSEMSTIRREMCYLMPIERRAASNWPTGNVGGMAVLEAVAHTIKAKIPEPYSKKLEDILANCGVNAMRELASILCGIADESLISLLIDSYTPGRCPCANGGQPWDPSLIPDRPFLEPKMGSMYPHDTFPTTNPGKEKPPRAIDPSFNMYSPDYFKYPSGYPSFPVRYPGAKYPNYGRGYPLPPYPFPYPGSDIPFDRWRQIPPPGTHWPDLDESGAFIRPPYTEPPLEPFPTDPYKPLPYPYPAYGFRPYPKYTQSLQQ